MLKIANFICVFYYRKFSCKADETLVIAEMARALTIYGKSLDDEIM